MAKLMPESFKGNLSDALYYYRQGNYNLVKLATMVYTWGGLDYIAPARYPEDLASVTAITITGFLSCLAREGVYDAVIVDWAIWAAGGSNLTFARLCICLSKKMCFLQLKLRYLKSTWMLRDGRI